MACVAEWKFKRGFNFMASAVTGGAIVYPADHPTTWRGKLTASCVASLGVGLFGFMVATLSNSVTAPLVKIMGIGVAEAQETLSVHRIVRDITHRLLQLALLVMGTNLFAALVFGSFIAYLENWDVFTGFKQISCVVLGGGIEFHNMPEVTKAGQLMYTIVGVWSLGITGLMIAIVGDPGQIVVSHMLGLDLDEGTTARQALRMLSWLVGVVLPITLLGTMLVVACIMTPLTTWGWEGSFWAALPAISGGAAALHSEKNPPLTTCGACILICASSAGFFVLSLMMGVGGELVGPIMEGPVFGPILGKKRGALLGFLALWLISLVLVPALVFCGSCMVGVVLATAQGWPFLDGFWWCVSVQLGGGMALTDKTIDSGMVSMFLGAILVGWSVGISILTIGMSGAPVVTPLMEAMGMTIDPRELAGIYAAVKAVKGVAKSLEGVYEEVWDQVEDTEEAIANRLRN